MFRKTIIFACLLFLSISVYSQERDNFINIYFYPHLLTPEDSLVDGPGERDFSISEDTILVWIDLFPQMFFAHETTYVFISREGIRVETGNWWPVLNGKPILFNETSGYALISPFVIPPVYSGDYLEQPKVLIHFYPHELTSQDALSEGPLERLFRIDDNSLFIWVDFLPGAFFAHPTAFILISKAGVRVENTGWWPVLNGRTILYNQQNKIALISPFKLAYPDETFEGVRERKLKK